MQVIDFINIYAAATFSLAAIAIVAEFIAIPLFDLVRRLSATSEYRSEATIYEMPKPAAKKSYKEWDTIQLDVAA